MYKRIIEMTFRRTSLRRVMLVTLAGQNTSLLPRLVTLASQYTPLLPLSSVTDINRQSPELSSLTHKKSSETNLPCLIQEQQILFPQRSISSLSCSDPLFHLNLMCHLFLPCSFVKNFFFVEIPFLSKHI